MRIKIELPLTLKEIADILNTSLKVPDCQICAITTFSELAQENDLFIALKGENTDGDYYSENARKRGAYILSHNEKNADIKAENTLLAILKIAEHYKSKLQNLKHTIAITGSVGKTTTKNILSSMLSPHFKVHSTEGNYNNILGLSYTLLSAPKDTEVLVCEVGMNHFGEIKLLSEALAPDISVITNIGTAHIGNLGSRENIAKAKLEIISGMRGGTLIIPKDEPLLHTSFNTKTFSASKNSADYNIIPREINQSGIYFDIFTKKFIAQGQFTSHNGKHIMNSAIISIAVLDLLGIEKTGILNSLSEIESAKLRGKFINIGNYLVYDDTYSSSAEAVLNVMEMLSIHTERKRVCVLGDMLELGEKSEKLHEKIGIYAKHYNFDKVFTFGNFSNFIKSGAILAGMNEENIFSNYDLSSPRVTAEQIKNNTVGNELILIKASHSIHAERIIEHLRNLDEKTT